MVNNRPVEELEGFLVEEQVVEEDREANQFSSIKSSLSWQQLEKQKEDFNIACRYMVWSSDGTKQFFLCPGQTLRKWSPGWIGLWSLRRSSVPPAWPCTVSKSSFPPLRIFSFQILLNKLGSLRRRTHLRISQLSSFVSLTTLEIQRLKNSFGRSKSHFP